MKAKIQSGIVLALTVVTACGTTEKDRFLKTLDIQETHVSYAASLDLEQYTLFDTRKVIKFGDWVVISTPKGDWNLTFVNLVSGESFQTLRHGRGPGEILNGSSLHRVGNCAVYSDYSNSICVSLKLQETINEKRAVLDTVGIFKGQAARPVYLCKCGDGFVSGNPADPSIWYSYYDSQGNVLSSIQSIIFDEISGAGKDFLLSMMLSSKYASNPSASKICVANVWSGALSFASVRKGVMTEYFRVEAVPPDVVSHNGSVTFDRNGTAYFQDLEATEDGILALYSGNSFSSTTLPCSEGYHILQYSWDGKVKKHYALSHNVSSMYWEENVLYCLSNYPSSKLYIYKLD